MSLVKIAGLHKRFGSNHVLKGIDLEIAEGEVVAIIGRSGSSNEHPAAYHQRPGESIDGGEIVVDGATLHAGERTCGPLRLKVGMVFQQFNLFPHLTAGANVMLPRRPWSKKTPRPEAMEIARKMMAKVGLSENSTAIPTSSPAGSSSVSRSPGPWR